MHGLNDKQLIGVVKFQGFIPAATNVELKINSTYKRITINHI